MLNRQEKEKVLNSIKVDIEKANALFLTNMVGLSAPDVVSIRKDVREARGKIIIAKNTLFKKAAEGTKAGPLFSDLKGPNAVAFAFDDAPAVAKCLKRASVDFDIVRIKGGLHDGEILTAGQVQTLADLPSRDEMLGIVLATMMAPVSAFVRVLNAIKNKNEGE